MAENNCLGQVHACYTRFSRLDNNGVPLPGANNMIVTDSLMRVGVSNIYTDGDEIEEKNGCGSVAVNYKTDDSYKRIDVTIELVMPNPYIQEMLSGGTLLTHDAPYADRRGFAAPSLGPITGNGIGMEVWSRRVDDAGEQDVESPWAWWLFPKIRNLRLGDHEHGASANKPTFTGQGYENPNWFNGPANDWPTTSSSVYQWIPTHTTPIVTCGYQELAAS